MTSEYKKALEFIADNMVLRELTPDNNVLVETAFETIRAALQSAEKVDGLVKALEWYAGDGKNRDFKIVDDKGSQLADFKMFGDRAREALADFGKVE